jgi:flagellar basal-body rod protein FlgB
MDPTRIGLFDLAERRLNWLGRRQSVLAQNIANVDTPGYRPRDIASFGTTLSGLDQTPFLTRTSPGHLAGTADPNGGTVDAVKPNGRQPDGNAVSLDQELTKVADTETNQALTTSIFQTYLGLFRTALGSGAG